MESPDSTVPLGKFLALRTALSRRAAVEAVKAGRVRLDGETVREPARRVTPGSRVELDGNAVETDEARPLRYYMLNKPRGYVCSSADPHAEKLALDLLPVEPGVRLFSAGRLDTESEGLLIFSNDGDYVEELSHPRNRVLKRYRVEVARPLSEREMSRLREGIADDGEVLRAIEVIPRGGCAYEFVLNEGRKREIRRMTAAVGAPTKRLRRFAVGALELGDLPEGKFRELSPEERRLSLIRAPEQDAPSPSPPRK